MNVSVPHRVSRITAGDGAYPQWISGAGPNCNIEGHCLHPLTTGGLSRCCKCHRYDYEIVDNVLVLTKGISSHD